jgi:hypothetical protein
LDKEVDKHGGMKWVVGSGYQLACERVGCESQIVDRTGQREQWLKPMPSQIYVQLNLPK